MIKEYSVEGMHCAACSSAVERCVLKIDGVASAEVSLLAKKLTVECDASVLDETIINSVNAIGFEASLFLEKGKEEQQKKERDEQRARKRKGARLCVSAVLLLFVMYFSMGYMADLPFPSFFAGGGGSVWRAVAQLAFSSVIIALNYRYFTSGAKALFKGAPNMDTLVSLGSAASLAWSIYQTVRCIMFYSAGDFAAAEHTVHGLWYESAVMILVLVTFGKFIEEGAEKRASDALESIAKLLPDSATLLVDGVEQTVSASAIKEGDIILVKPGERIAADGVVLTGYTSVDESALTGESMPSEKGEGDTVFAASANISGRITIRATRVGSATALSKISELVGKAAAGKAPIARLADKVSGIFTPVVMSISVVTFAIWFIITKDVAQSLNAAISVLVISCPCALGLATPVAVTVGCGTLAKKGVLLRSAKELERLSKIDTVVFDKTGTLTLGKPEIKEHKCSDAVSDTALIEIAASLEKGSAHPLSGAVLECSEKCGVTVPACEDMRDVSGKGICGTVNGKECFAGSRRYMTELGVDVSSVDAHTEKLQADGQTLIYVAREKQLLGVLGAGDTLHENSKEAIARLHSLGIKTVVLSGDNRSAVLSTAKSLGIDEDCVFADLLPEDKATAVAKLKGDGKCVMMVGDGINDAPALASADIGAAVYGGTDVAAYASDVLLMKNGIYPVASMLEYSRRVLRIIKQNLFWAFFYNSLGIPIAAGVLYPAFSVMLSPMIASAMMTVSSLFVVSNALRLRRY